MYDYRKMTPEERQQVIRERRERGFPWHAPPHFPGVSGEYLISAACFEHQPVFADPTDLSWLLDQTLNALDEVKLPCYVFLPNHYHVLLRTEDIAIVSEVLRLLHSRVATDINGRHRKRGRRVWYRFSDRFIRSERHHWATVNYIHYNPVKHGYVDRPIGEYRKGWDW
jgi:putative transposase